MDLSTGIFFWGFLIVYGVIMFILSPKTVSLGGFFRGEDKSGKDANPWMITASIFIAWIFAKSVTNAANMGQNFGIVGGIGYAVYWLCIPLTGYALYRLRRKFAMKGMVSFLTEHYGVAAAFCFSAAILIRLFNEVWSNTSVVVAQSLGIVALFMMAVIMIATAGSTLDSTFTALAKLTARDLPGILGKRPKTNPRIIGIIFMIIFAVIGNLPMVMGASIIAATTISGTMIMGLGPIFLMHGVGPVKPTKVGFMLAFWIGMILGIWDTIAPATLSFMNIGAGKYANFLGVNLWGAILCWAAYIIPGIIASSREKAAGIEPTWKGLSAEELARLDKLEAENADYIPEYDPIEKSPEFQAMLKREMEVTPAGA